MTLKSRHQRRHWKLWEKIMGSLEGIFFNATSKLVALRLLLVALLVNLSIHLASTLEAAPGTQHYLLDVLTIFFPVTFIFLHHVASALILRFIPQWLDFLLVTCELGYLSTPISPFLWAWVPGFASIQWNSLEVWDVITFMCIFSVLVFFFFSRLSAIVRHRGKKLVKPFDLLEDRPQARTHDLPESSLSEGIALLVGRSIWRNQFIGEALYVRLLRGFVAGGLLLMIIGNGLMSIAVAPTLESTSIPTRKTRTDIYNYPEVWLMSELGSWADTFNDATWSFYFTLLGSPWQNTTDMLQKAINVTVTNRLIPQIRTDVQEEGPLIGLCENQLSSRFVKSICPHTFGFRPVLDTNEIINGTWAHNDVHISIDFSLIDPTAFGASAALAVYPTLTGSIDTGTMFKDIVPFPLPPGVNYYGTVSVRGRQAYDGRSQTASSFGLFSSPKNYLVPSIRYVVTDPLQTRSQNNPSNISTLRLSCEFDTGEFRVETDQRDKTVFGGFATVGGLFTFVSGIFTLIFGTTFLRILFDLKPLSVFGLIQKWDRKRIVNAYLDAYPLLRAEVDSEASQRGVVAVLQDHLLDMKLIKEVLDAESRGESEEQEERANLHNAWEMPELEGGAMFLPRSNHPPPPENKAA